MIHHRAILFDDGVTYNWVSLDGATWLPVNRPPEPDDTEESVAALFAGDGNFQPMTFATAYLDHLAAATPQPEPRPAYSREDYKRDRAARDRRSDA